MGRKSYEAEDALISAYKNVIITHRKQMALPENCLLANSPGEALTLLRDEPEIFILGGSTIFEQTMPLFNYMYLTIVHHHFSGDAFFPEIDWSQWEEVKSIFHPADAKHDYSFSLNEYRRTDSIT